MNAKIKYPAGPAKDFGHGPRINVVAVLENQEETRIYGDANDPTLIALKKGQEIMVAKEGKYYKIVGVSPITTNGISPQNGTKPDTHNNQNTNPFETIVKENANKYELCLRIVKDVFKTYDLSTHDLKSIATTVYIRSI